MIRKAWKIITGIAYIGLIGTKLSSSIWKFESRFHHPKAEVISTLYPKMHLKRDERLRLQDVSCILYQRPMRSDYWTFPLKVSICDLSNESKAFVGPRFSTLSFYYVRTSDDNEIGALDVAMYLAEYDPYCKSYRPGSDENFSPPIIDDNWGKKLVEELKSYVLKVCKNVDLPPPNNLEARRNILEQEASAGPDADRRLTVFSEHLEIALYNEIALSGRRRDEADREAERFRRPVAIPSITS